MSFILYCYIPHLLSTGKVKTTNKRPYVGVNGTVEGLVIQSDKPLCYEENGELPPYDDGSDADTLGGHPAEDFVLDSELTEALAEKADTNHSHSPSQITSGTFSGQVNANGTAAANIGTAQMRDIYAGTTDIGAGASLATGVIYLVYE